MKLKPDPDHFFFRSRIQAQHNSTQRGECKTVNSTELLHKKKSWEKESLSFDSVSRVQLLFSSPSLASALPLSTLVRSFFFCFQLLCLRFLLDIPTDVVPQSTSVSFQTRYRDHRLRLEQPRAHCRGSRKVFSN